MELIKLKDICEFEKGSTGLAKAESGEYPLVTTGAERKSSNAYQFNTKAVCIPLVSSTGHGHASLKNVHYQEGKFALGSILVALTTKDESKLDIQFLHLYISQLKDQVLVPLMSGAANVALSVTKIQTIEIPLPPLEKQQEIVRKFKSIVREEDELKFELNYQQILLKNLRQQILQEAIEGKLTAEWRTDNPDVEPACELLKRIAAEKAQLVKDKKIKNQKLYTPICEKEKPFDLPNGWEWCRLGEIITDTDSGWSPQCKVHPASTGKWGVLKTTSVQHMKFLAHENKELPSSLSVRTDLETKVGDILITRAGPTNRVGICALVRETPSSLMISDKLIRFHPITVCGEFIEIFIGSQQFQELIKDYKTGMAQSQVNISQINLKNVAISLPPLSEQKIIAFKIEKLLKLCDKLETQINQNQMHAEQLMQAVLKEAFSHDLKTQSTVNILEELGA